MKNMFWWTGVVEDRDDPERLGRCRVRIFGYHSDDIEELPTSDLPWALPLQSITSAAASGVGTAPVGIVTGSWVMGFFLDEDQAQQPVIMGTLAGKPSRTKQQNNREKEEKKKANVKVASTGLPLYDQDNKLVEVNLDNTSIENTFKPLTDKNLSDLLKIIGTNLSNNDYSKEGAKGELGKYQFKIEQLIALGYLSISLIIEETLDSTYTDVNENWLGKDGITSKKAFKASKTVQESAMKLLMRAYYQELINLNKISTDSPFSLVGGLLYTSHVFDTYLCDNLDKKDYTGKRAKDYFSTVVTGLGGDATSLESAVRQAASISSYIDFEADKYTTNEDLMKPRAFSDPSKIFPKYEYAGLSDVNKLAVGDTSHSYFETKRKKLITGIEVAGSKESWSEPEPAFYARYPYNQVIETESGHVIELDNTPLAERIHIFHRSGSYIEIDVNGSKVTKTVGDNYELVDNNNSVFVKGAHNLTVEGKTSIYVKDDAVIQVDGDLDVTSHGATVVQTAKSLGLVGKDIVISATDSINIASNGPINIKGSNFNAQASGNMSLKAKTDFAVQAGTTASIKGGAALLLDAVLVKTKMGATQIANIVMTALNPPASKNPDKTSLEFLGRPKLDNRDTLAALEKGQVNAILASDLAKTKEQANAPANLELNKGNGNIAGLKYFSCPFIGDTIFPFNFRISDNYLLMHFMNSKDAPDKVTRYVYRNPRVNISEGEIVCNLIQLANNCLEPIRRKFPDVIVHSALRKKDRPEPGYSDHGIGCAMDLNFKGQNVQYYVDVARWCITNIPYTQLLFEMDLEYNKTLDRYTKLLSTWVHISLRVNTDGTINKSGTGLNCGVFVNGKVAIANTIPPYQTIERFVRNLKQ